MYTREEMKVVLKSKMTEKRYEHTLGVEYTSACLAMRYGIDMEKAMTAGLLHDCAKHLLPEKKIQKCKKYNLPIQEFEQKNPELLHAKLGAYFAEHKYGVKDAEILSAITWHTTGRPAMTMLDKIVYIADYIEPNRNQAPNLSVVRDLAFKDIDLCLLTILQDSLDYLAKKKAAIDPMTKETHDYYVNVIEK
ncbi:MAG: bis(5'-nucleosyl)-tetraphosphatase (symmetrical) YqeK [Lachnospiraceae bacterium]